MEIKDLWCLPEGIREVSLHHHDLMENLQQIIRQIGAPRVDHIHWKWTRLATCLAGHGKNTSQLSMFHQGRNVQDGSCDF